MDQPNLETERLILRPLKAEDALRIQTLINHPEIAEMTSQIPHPYPLALAQAWIAVQPGQWNQRTGVVFGIMLKSEQVLIGVVSVQKLKQELPVLGYWLGTDYWSKGYATEAGRCLCKYVFNHLNISRIFACHLQRNPASGHVLQKIGFNYSGECEQYIEKKQKTENVANYLLMAKDLVAD